MVDDEWSVRRFHTYCEFYPSSTPVRAIPDIHRRGRAMTIAGILARIRAAFRLKPAAPEPIPQTVNPITKRVHKRRASLATLGLPANYRGSLKEAEVRASKGETLGETSETFHPVSPSHTLLKKEEYKKTHAHFISENWRPDDDGHQLGIEAFGTDGVEAAIARHRDTWASRPERLTEKQWQAKWRAWCRAHISPSLPMGPQLATKRKTETRSVASTIKAPSDPCWAPPIPAPVWDRLKTELGEAKVASWFGNATLGEVVGGTATVILPTKFASHYVEANFAAQTLRAIAAGHPDVTQVRFVVGATNRGTG